MTYKYIRVIGIVGFLLCLENQKPVFVSPAFADETASVEVFPEEVAQPASAETAPPECQPGTVASAAPDPVKGGGYVLGTGDDIRLTVYGEEDLSGQYQIDSTGVVALPLIGNVDAAGRSVDQLVAAVEKKLSKGYLKDPRVSIQVAAYRPFFILGEVARPGSYPYVNGLITLSAVATAGGYTYRADRDDIRVIHANTANKKEQDIDETADIFPGDIIRVTERYF